MGESEQEVLDEMFAEIRGGFREALVSFDADLPPLGAAPLWEFQECLDRLRIAQLRCEPADDLDPEAERQLCKMAEDECGVAAVFVTGFPLNSRPFYTHPTSDGLHAAGFDLLLRGLEP